MLAWKISTTLDSKLTKLFLWEKNVIPTKWNGKPGEGTLRSFKLFFYSQYRKRIFGS